MSFYTVRLQIIKFNKIYKIKRNDKTFCNIYGNNGCSFAFLGNNKPAGEQQKRFKQSSLGNCYYSISILGFNIILFTQRLRKQQN